jgi:hypothetical protein
LGCDGECSLDKGVGKNNDWIRWVVMTIYTWVWVVFMGLFCQMLNMEVPIFVYQFGDATLDPKHYPIVIDP